MRPIVLVLASALGLLFSGPVQAQHAGYTVGAIRWDPWQQASNGVERPQVEAVLSPPKWQSKAPECSTLVNSYTLSVGGCGTQANMDAEITAAAAAKIDYFAFVWYAEGNPFRAAWNFYQSSPLKENVKWSLITSYGRLVNDINTNQATFIGYLGQTNYQRVTIDSVSRPLVYILADGAATVSATATAISTMRSASQTAGHGNPYVIALLNNQPSVATSLGADAIGGYAWGVEVGSATPYATFTAAQEAFWTTLATAATGAGLHAIPTAITGADRRPRAERPQSFQIPVANGGQRAYVGASLHVVAGTPTAIATHVTNMLTWMAANTAANPARTSLIYSWNEHDEGGSTLAPSRGQGSAILDAVGSAL